MDDAKLRENVETANLMSPRQREIVQDDIDNLERALHGKPMRYAGQDELAISHNPSNDMVMSGDPDPLRVAEPDLVRKALSDDRQTMALGSVPELSGFAKDKIWEWFKEEKDKYSEGLLSEKQMWEPTWAHIQQHMKHEELNKRRGKMLTNIYRILEPDDDSFSLEAFRPMRPAPVNLPLYRRQHDMVSWSDEKEKELRARELDDQTYHTFLTLRAMGIETPKLIQRKLNIDQAMYEACVDRLNQSSHAFSDDEDLTADVFVDESESVETQDDLSGELTEKQHESFQQYGTQVLDLLIEQGPIMPKDIAGQLDCNAHEARNVLFAMSKLGLAEKHNDGYRPAEQSEGAET